MIVFLDSNILGLICNANSFYEAVECRNWFYTLYNRGARFITSDICSYEVRRGLIKASIALKEPVSGLLALENIKAGGYLEFLLVSTEVLELSAQIWAEASADGRTTRDDKNIDIDIIISAHYQILVDTYPGQQVIVATKNLKHISRFCEAANWQDIRL
jgi:predicted nucleic acid-binding protein